jgi:uncharacterized membrane protein (UPF0127 family)
MRTGASEMRTGAKTGKRPLPPSRTLLDDQGRVVCANCLVANRPLERMRGLLGRKGLEPGIGLLITRTSSIHTFFMKFSIDAVFLDHDLRVRSVARHVRPFRIVWRRGSRSVLELGSGESLRVALEEGSRLAWQL